MGRAGSCWRPQHYSIICCHLPLRQRRFRRSWSRSLIFSSVTVYLNTVMNVRKLIKKLIPRGLFAAVEPYGHLLEAFFVNLINGFPARGLKVIGVTGTNGKTTTTFLIHRMLHEAGYKVGFTSTVAWGVGD